MKKFKTTPRPESEIIMVDGKHVLKNISGFFQDCDEEGNVTSLPYTFLGPLKECEE